VVEHDLAKVGVEGSSPFARSKIFPDPLFTQIVPFTLSSGGDVNPLTHQEL
jgi:hypothetical protein